MSISKDRVKTEKMEDGEIFVTRLLWLTLVIRLSICGRQVAGVKKLFVSSHNLLEWTATIWNAPVWLRARKRLYTMLIHTLHRDGEAMKMAMASYGDLFPKVAMVLQQEEHQRNTGLDE